MEKFKSHTRLSEVILMLLYSTPLLFLESSLLLHSQKIFISAKYQHKSHLSLIQAEQSKSTFKSLIHAIYPSIISVSFSIATYNSSKGEAMFLSHLANPPAQRSQVNTSLLNECTGMPDKSHLYTTQQRSYIFILFLVEIIINQ